MNRPLTWVGLIALAAVVISTAGCGFLTLERTSFPNAAIGGEGEGLVLDDIQKVVDDPDLTREEKAEALRDLGIEDEDLLDALLA